MTSETRPDRETKLSATPSRILDSASLEFADYGLAGARIARIAASAGCNKQMIYHYFGDKDGLYDAVQRRMASRARASIEQERAKGLPFLDSNLFEGPEFGTRSEWMQLQLWDGLTGIEGHAHLNSIRSENFELLRDWIRADQDAGLITSELAVDQVLALVFLARLVPIAMPTMFRNMIGREGTLEGRESLRVLVRKIVESAPAVSN
ncbi:TetR/AcrR family transcriptional regulator [Arthrobacter sp. OV608]|uniref:TetR/AcrR family transcriptional regulator n=1 Tax=Arthrobacter sp. OV608 TaxID=1882768 RepID=UPI000B869092|nr:TetR/AcrR family transcriptional regulator [Arthrobacter sp. OV608]